MNHIIENTQYRAGGDESSCICWYFLFIYLFRYVHTCDQIANKCNKSNSQLLGKKRILKSIRLKQKRKHTVASCSPEIPAAPTNKLANYLSNVLTIASLDRRAGPGAMTISRQEVKGGMGSASAAEPI